MKKWWRIGFSWAWVLGMLGCTPENPITDAGALLATSADTLYFDSVFASTRSITLPLKIFNPNSRPLVLSEISLAGGSASAFRLNVDGVAGPLASDLRIAAGDSLYVFALVSPLPTASNGVYLAADSIRIRYNGQLRQVQLRAEVRNAFFLRGGTLNTDTSWTNDRPIVITRPLTVAAGRTLTLNAGTQVYASAGAPLVVQGRLLCNGSDGGAGQVRFASDRLDQPYKSFPAGWPGIVLGQNSSGSRMTHTRIANAYQAITLVGPGQGTTPKLSMQQCEITNTFDAAITGLASSLEANNCLILNAGQNLLLQGGDYQLTNCTVATFQSLFIDHNLPVLGLSNGIAGQFAAPFNGRFVNCILWGVGGRAESEIVTNRQGSTAFTASFANCIYRMKDGDPANASFAASLRNADPLFDSVSTGRQFYNLRLRSGSPAINAGQATPFLQDLTGKTRTNQPDIGCYEF